MTEHNVTDISRLLSMNIEKNDSVIINDPKRAGNFFVFYEVDLRKFRTQYKLYINREISLDNLDNITRYLIEFIQEETIKC